MITELTTDAGELARGVTDAQRIILEQKTPQDNIRWRKGRGGKMLAYVDHAYVTALLNNAFGWDWDFETDEAEVLEVNGKPFEVKVRGRLTVRSPRGTIIKMQYGCQPIEFLRNAADTPVSLGDAYKGAASDALKKCASLLGIALDLYGGDSDVHQPTQRSPQPAPQPQPANKPATNGQPARWNDNANTIVAMFQEANRQFGLSQADTLLALLVDDPRTFDGTKQEAWKMISELAARKADIPL